MVNVVRWVAVVLIGITLLPFVIVIFELGILVMLFVGFLDAIGLNGEAGLPIY